MLVELQEIDRRGWPRRRRGGGHRGHPPIELVEAPTYHGSREQAGDELIDHRIARLLDTDSRLATNVYQLWRAGLSIRTSW